MGRAPCCAKVGLKKGRWSAEEDAILINYIKQRGEAGAGSWRCLPKNAGLLRCGKSCRLRWINYLRSDLRRGNFTSHEQDTIIKLQAQFGNKWSLIASQLEGRTDNEIKNYWNSSLCRRITTCSDALLAPLSLSSPNINNITPATQTVSSRVPSPPAAAAGAGVIIKKRKGRTSRAAMQKNKINTFVKSSKYHQDRVHQQEQTAIYSSNTNDLSRSCSSSSNNCCLSRTNSCTTYDTVCFSSSSMTSTQTQEAALKLKEDSVLETLLLCQNDSQLDGANFHEGVDLSFDNDVGIMGDIYREYELAVEAADLPPVIGICGKEIGDETQGALPSSEWDWINDVIVHPDIIDPNQTWSEELDDNLTWLWEYDQYAHCFITNNNT